MVQVVGNLISLKALQIIDFNKIPRLDFQFYSLDVEYDDNELVLCIFFNLLQHNQRYIASRHDFQFYNLDVHYDDN